MSGPWEELAISETKDTRAIRRAYAGRLRTIDQQKDPAAFQRLRQAYEWALELATEELAQAPSAMPSEADAPAEEETSQQELTPDEVLVQNSVARIREAMEAKLYDVAFDAYDKGSAQGIFPFGYREYLLDAIMDAIVRDSGLSVGQFAHLLGRAGWNEPPASTEQISQTRHFAMLRQEADSWFVRLQSLAAGDGPNMHLTYEPKPLWRWLPRLIERRNAGLFFGAAAIPKLTPMGAQDLRWKLLDYGHRESWLKGRIDPQDAARARQVLEQYDKYGFLLDPVLAFVIGMIWLGREGHLEIVIPLVGCFACVRAVIVRRRHRRQLAGLKDQA